VDVRETGFQMRRSVADVMACGLFCQVAETEQSYPDQGIGVAGLFNNQRQHTRVLTEFLLYLITSKFLRCVNILYRNMLVC